MKKQERVQSFREQMRQSMAELRQMIENNETFDGNGRFTVRTYEVSDPSQYDAKKVKRTREALGVSQAVFAHLVGVSTVLVRSWERGVREPAPVARRVMDQMLANPKQFAALVKPIRISPGTSGGRRRTASRPASPRKRSA